MSLRSTAILFVLAAGTGWCQSPPAKPAFDIADVHVSPRGDWIKDYAHDMSGGFLAGDRYQLHRATMLDLIRTAYNVDADKVFGGPNWLDYDRYEVDAKAKPGTRPATLKLMLQALLAGRFGLVIKADTQPVAGYVLSTGKGDLRVKQAIGGAGTNGCERVNRFDAGVMTTSYQCHGMTMDEFALFLHGPVAEPVLNSTSLEGMWDIDFQYAQGRMVAGTAKDNVIGAVNELGLKLEQGTVPQPVLTIEAANEQPSANPPGIAQALPPLPVPQFEVASVKVCDPNEKGGSRSPQFEPGGRVTANCMPPAGLIREAWNLAPFQTPEGEPKSFGGTSIALNVSVIAKAPAGTPPDRDTLNAMMRALLIDRYKMKVHYEDRQVDAQTLVGVKPKLTQADPHNRTGCAREQLKKEDGSIGLTRLVCRNMTMAQFAEQIQAYDVDIFYPVLDGTAIAGSWDFTIEYDPLANLRARVPFFAAAAPSVQGQAPDPTGALSFTDAIQKQLGLKLEVHKRAEPVLIIDHMEERPSDN